MSPMEWPPQPPPVPPDEEEEKKSPESRIEDEPAAEAPVETIESEPEEASDTVEFAESVLVHEEKPVEGSKEGIESREAVQAKTTVAASVEMLELLKQNNGVSDQHKETLARLADHIRTHHPNPSAEDARKVAIAVVGAVDVMLVDNIKQANKTPFYQQEFQEMYRREKAAESYVRKIAAGEVVGGLRAKIGEERLTIVTANEEEFVNNELQEALSEREGQVENDPNGRKESYERVSNVDEMVEKIPNGLSGQKRIIYLDHPVSAEEMIKVKEKLESSSEENITNTLVCLRVRLNETMSGFYFLGSPTLAQSFGGYVEQRGAKKSILPTQDKWLAFLENGLVPPMNYFPDTRDPIIKKANLDSFPGEGVPAGDRAGTETPDDIGEFVSSILKEGDLQRWQEYSRRRLNVLVQSEGPEAAERYLQRTKEHYEFFFERNGARPDVVLTRGGFSANETAINTISNLASEGERKAYILPGWYYENQHAIEDKLDVVGSADEANILFLNSSPNGFVEDPDLASNYAQRRDQLAEDLIRRAAGNPDKKFFLVVDKTTDLLYESFTDISDLPDNLIVMETSSITKNQRGGRNYFYGTVACWSKESQREVLDEAVISARGELTPLAVVNFPRLRRSEVEKRQEKLLELEKNFQEAFEEAQAGLPPENRWKFQRNSGFCALLVPPFEALLKITKERMELGQLVSEKDLTERATFFTSELIPLGVEIGDSFGLDQTRLTAINLKLPESYGVTVSDRSRRRAGPQGAKELETFGFNRIAFGYESTPEQIRKIGETLGKKLIENFPPEMFETRG